VGDHGLPVRVTGFQGIDFHGHPFPPHVDREYGKNFFNGFPAVIIGTFHDQDFAHGSPPLIL
jgi:hypothetical protein